MFNPHRLELSLGSPQIAVGPPAELRELLTALQVASSRDKASLSSSLTEGAGETNSETIQPVTEAGLLHEASVAIAGDNPSWQEL